MGTRVHLAIWLPLHDLFAKFRKYGKAGFEGPLLLCQKHAKLEII